MVAAQVGWRRTQVRVPVVGGGVQRRLGVWRCSASAAQVGVAAQHVNSSGESWCGDLAGRSRPWLVRWRRTVLWNLNERRNQLLHKLPIANSQEHALS